MGGSCSRSRGSLSEVVRHYVNEWQLGECGSIVQERAMQTAQQLLNSSTQSFHDVYCEVKTVSYGASSTVVRANHRRTYDTVACKIIPKLKSTCHVVAQRKLRARVLAEIATMKTVEAHRNAAKLREVYEDDKNYYLVMDYYSGGELFEHIVQRKEGFTEDQAAGIMRDLLDFLAYSHSLGVVHADIKPENIVFTENGVDGKLMVLDFGLSVFCKTDETHKNVFGTLGYCSPEMANDVTGQKTDVWSAGVILYFMLSGKPPFRFVNKQATLCRLKQKPKVAFADDAWDVVSKEAKTFIQILLDPCPDKRVSAVEALKLRWLQDSLLSMRSSHKLHNRTCKSLELFGNQSRLKRLFWQRIASYAPQYLVGDQLAQFRIIDLDGNGVVDYQELEAALKAANPKLTKDEVNQVFAAMDVDQSGSIDRNEFVAATIGLLDPEYQEEIAKNSFNRIDQDGSGLVPRQEMRDALLRELSDFIAEDASVVADLDGEIESMDANGDGVISFEEFKFALTEKLVEV